jgi:hypothetical protein
MHASFAQKRLSQKLCDKINFERKFVVKTHTMLWKYSLPA